MTTTTFSEAEIGIFRSMLGKQFDKFKCDPFIYSPAVYGIIGLYIDGSAYKLTATCENVRRFFNDESVAAYHITETADQEIKSYMDGGKLIETPISGKITAIDIINDHQTVTHGEKSTSFDHSVGVIFHLEDTREISFEIKTWFSEMITVEKGYRLIEKLTSTDDFLEEWEGCDGYTAECHHEIITLK